MRRKRTISGRRGERGVVILLVAIVLLFVVGAMAVLAIDLVTFYTARSEAQLAADGAALAGARVLANSGMTSDPSDVALVANAESLATTLATQVAVQNKVGGRNLNAGEVTVNFQGSSIGTGSNPRVTVQVTRNDLPTFFARIWGRTQITVSASATAEAYNPSSLTASFGNGPPVAPVCVKPWLLPNKADPLDGSKEIFDPGTGAIQITAPPLGQLLAGANTLKTTCTNCALLPKPATAWNYFPGAQTSFPAPTQSLPACSAVLVSAYQLSIAGCVQQPIACGQGSSVDLDTAFTDPNADQTAADAVNCLTHAQANQGDTFDPAWISGQPFQFIAGNDNPVVNARGTNVLVSDSLVTIPVVDVSSGQNFSTSPVKVVGFVQMFLNPDGTKATNSGIPARVINLAGCGTTATGQPIQGNGASPVVVRLVAP